MPSRRFEWHEHIMAVVFEYRVARIAVDRLINDAAATPDIFAKGSDNLRFLRKLDGNPEGTFIVRLFAAFEAALRPYDRARHHDLHRLTDASVLIDQIGGRRGHGITMDIRQGAHEVRRFATTGRTSRMKIPAR